jgi:hypothetical protein
VEVTVLGSLVAHPFVRLDVPVLAKTARKPLTAGPSMRATSSTYSRPPLWLLALL